MKDVTFRIDYQAAGRTILRGNAKMISLQNSTMGPVLATIRAQFFQQFGFEGKFDMQMFTTDRSTVKIFANDARTAKTLKANPKWMAQFIDILVV